jgi:tRNA uridine 5-carboxymethylaminomethyl modification enzyme
LLQEQTLQLKVAQSTNLFTDFTQILLPSALDKTPLVINRHEGYIGVLIDDLTQKGTNEPYRMFTSRSEFRVILRPENADLRLTEKGFNAGIVSEKRFKKMVQIRENLKQAKEQLKNFKMTNKIWREKLKMPSVKSAVEKR